MEKILVDRGQLIGELDVEMFDDFGVAQHDSPRWLVRDDLSPLRRRLARGSGR
jgi:hypothetical protein